MPLRVPDFFVPTGSIKPGALRQALLRGPIIGICACLWIGLTPLAPAAQPQVGKAPVTAAAAPSVSKLAAAPTKPLWSELTPLQQMALKPLDARWDTLNESNKRRWLALSRNYARLSTEQQRTLHGRMTEWSALSGRQRVQARLNFAEVKQLAPNERNAKWAAYQALSDEDKRKLAEKAPVRPKSAAVPVRPVPAQKLVQVPPPPGKGKHGAKIQLAPPAATMQGSLGPGLAPAAAPSGPAAAATPASSRSVLPPIVRTTEQPPPAP